MPDSIGNGIALFFVWQFAVALVTSVFMITLYLCSGEIIANAQAMAGEV